MKSLGVLLCSLMFAQVSIAGEVLSNCFSGSRAEFFAYDLEDIAKANETPVLLLNGKKEVVGVISVSPDHQKENAKVVAVNKLSLCSSLETDEFYYADGDASDLMKWVGAGAIEITQDEGLLELEASLVKTESYASLIKVTFKAYDVFEEDTLKYKGQPDYKEDWGIPKGKGEFYFYAPSNWGK